MFGHISNIIIDIWLNELPFKFIHIKDGFMLLFNWLLVL